MPLGRPHKAGLKKIRRIACARAGASPAWPGCELIWFRGIAETLLFFWLRSAASSRLDFFLLATPDSAGAGAGCAHARFIWGYCSSSLRDCRPTPGCEKELRRLLEILRGTRLGRATRGRGPVCCAAAMRLSGVARRELAEQARSDQAVLRGPEGIRRRYPGRGLGLADRLSRAAEIVVRVPGVECARIWRIPPPVTAAASPVGPGWLEWWVDRCFRPGRVGRRWERISPCCCKPANISVPARSVRFSFPRGYLLPV